MNLPTTIHSYIALGSNLAQPIVQLRTALQSLSQLPHTQLIAHSAFFRTQPIGPAQPDFINACAKLQTQLTPLQLLDECQRIEHDQGRVRSQHWGPRTLDLDILLYGSQRIEEPRLTIPHREMFSRLFVLLPLKEIYDGDLDLTSAIEKLDREHYFCECVESAE